jgi:hypothetical protein
LPLDEGGIRFIILFEKSTRLRFVGFVCILFGVGIVIADLFFPQMISEVHASWRHTYHDSQICSPLIYSAGYSSSGSRLSASYISSNCQITVDRTELNPLPTRRSTQWTPKDPSQASMSDSMAETIIEDPFMEEIDRATNLPRRTPLPQRKSDGSLANGEGGVQPLEGAAGSLSTVIRDGRGYVNPVMWDINMREEEEDRLKGFSTDDHLDRGAEFTHL